MQVSVFANSFSDPKPLEIDWPDLVKYLTTHVELEPEAKKLHKIPAWAPAQFSPGSKRKARNVEAVSLLVLDIDHAELPEFQALLTELERGKLRALIYSTWSHGKNTPNQVSARLVVPLATPVAGEDWKAFHGAAMRRFGVVSADPHCSDASRLYYGPFVPKGELPRAFWLEFHGEPLDLDIIHRSIALPTMPANTGPQFLTRERLQALAAKWKKSHNETRGYMGQVLTRMLEGEAYAQEGERDKITFQLVRDLVALFPRVDSPSLARFFASSLQAMAKPGSPTLTVEQVEYKIERAKDDLAAETAAEVHPPEILESLKQTTQTPDLGKAWIIQRRDSYWMLGPAGYEGPYTSADAPIAALKILEKSGIPLAKMTPNGVRRTPLPDLVAGYGTAALHAEISSMVEHSRYDAERHTMIQAKGRPLKVAPAYHEGCAAFIAALSLHHPTYLERWLSQLFDLTQPLCGLILTGDPGIGKSLFTSALAGCWGKAWTSLEHAMSDFNPLVAEMPFIVGDEGIPKDRHGAIRTTQLREMVSSLQRVHREKYLPEMIVRGALRIVVCANNHNILAENREHLTPADIEAIHERFLHIPVHHSEFIREVYTTVGPKQIIQHMPAHVAYLQGAYPRDGRFGVVPPSREAANRMTVNTGARSEVCEIICLYCNNPKTLNATQGTVEPLVLWDGKGRLLANVRGIRMGWECYMPPTSVPPPTRLLARALAGISVPDTQGGHVTLRQGPFKKQIWYRVIDLDLVRSWARETDFCDASTIRPPGDLRGLPVAFEAGPTNEEGA